MPPIGHTSSSSAALPPTERHPDVLTTTAPPAALIAVVRALDEMAWLADEAGAIAFTNGSFIIGTGCPPPGPAGLVPAAGLEMLYGPLTSPNARDAIAAAIGNQQPLRLELDLARRGGAPFRAELRLDPIDDDGTTWFLGILKDLTDRRAADAVVARARDVIEAIAHGVPGVVYQFGIDARGRRRYSFISEGCARVFGFDASEVTAGGADRILAAVPPEDRDALMMSIETSRRTLEPWRHVFRCEVHGEYRWIRGASLPMRLGNGDTVWNGMLIDVTDEMVAKAAAVDALERAEAANRSKTEFLAAVSHELRTPLNAVIGFAEVFRDELHGPLGDARYRDHAGHILGSGRRLLDMVNSVLEFAQIESGGLQLDESDVLPRALIEPCLAALADKIGSRDLTAVVRVDGHPHRLIVDRLQMRRVLSHLLSNAVKFTPDGGSLSIDVESDAEGGVDITVTDTGIGIAPEDLRRAFEPFAQIDGALSRRYEGLGLGLPLARAIVESHGGRLTLDPVAGGGTRAGIWLPAVRVLRA
ncbi:MAG TPA: ATP-binding protein [Aliidongia sp.]|uniref:PAS domain-containing sensor histidine kinase n=1 Tax=Aliidongia sp. TaxID=1914230 RepID=UPI002DDCFD65|nr:ATP-binding protein [Aliidongia sp.]HEV2676460.1 ATP-binding protein [Aliidongia sp.]